MGSHDEEIIAFCDANNITVEAYSPLSGQRGAQSVFKDETVKAIADTHNVSAAQVALRWIVQRGHTIAVLSSSSEHQANDADLWSFELSDDDGHTHQTPGEFSPCLSWCERVSHSETCSLTSQKEYIFAFSCC